MLGSALRRLARDAVKYTPEQPDLVRDLEQVREAIPGATIVPPYVGDTITRAIADGRLSRCLEVGMATGSTAAYMLRAVDALGGGEVVSIDRAQTTLYHGVGVQTVARTGLARLHTLIENDSIVALFDLWRAGRRFDFVFMDGWKTFDHLAAELYFVARLLERDGVVMFDDYQMPSVRRAVAMLEGHYAMDRVNLIPASALPELTVHALLEVRRLHLSSAIALVHGSVASLRKRAEPDELAVTKDWNFYAPF